MKLDIKSWINMFKKFILSFIKRYPVLFYFIVSHVINGILFRIFTIGTYKIRAMIFDFGVILLLSAFSFLIKKGNKSIYYFSISIFLVLICVINSIYYNYYDSFTSISLLATSVFINDVGEAVVDLVIKVSDFIYFWQLIGLFFVVRKYHDEVNYQRSFSFMSVMAIFLLLFGWAIPPYKSLNGFIKLWNRVSVVDCFGVYLYQIDDMVQSLSPAINTMFGYDKALKDTVDYYSEINNYQNTNEYTGIFEGKNVLVIHAESLQTWTINKKMDNGYITPNLNELASSGLFFDNFYAQVGVGTSSDSEFTFSTSLLPSNKGTVFVNYYDNNYQTIQKLLHNKGYYVFSMHGNVGYFWNRDVMHLNMGYDKFYSKDSFVIDEEYGGLGLSDGSFFRQAVPMIKDIKNELKRPFYGTLITLTNHTPWKDTEKYSTFSVKKSVNIDGNLVYRDYLEDMTIGKYIKAVNYMDMAIGNFIRDLDTEGLLDDTVIVIYGDHDARIDYKEYNYMYNYDPILDRVLTRDDPGYKEFNLYDYEINKKVPFIIWSKDLADKNLNKVVSIPMGMIDAMPTLGNMLNIYNKYALGHDILDSKNKNNFVAFKDESFILDKLYYNSKKNETYVLENKVVSDEYLDKCKSQVNKIIEVSDNIISYNLINDMK